MEIQKQYLEKFHINLIKWYPFTNKESILLINNNSEIIKVFFESLFNEVVEINDLDELINLDEKERYDYLLIRDEFVSLLQGFDSTLDFYQKMRMLLKQDGTLLFAFNNAISSEQWCDQEQCNLKDTALLWKIMDAIPMKTFRNRKVYYPLPNYEHPNIIFTDKYLPDEFSINKNLAFSFTNKEKLFSNNFKISHFIEKEKALFPYITNSYLVEVSNQTMNDIHLVSYHNLRKEKYQLQTISKGSYFYKTSYSEHSIAHLNTIKRNIDIMKKYQFNILDDYHENEIMSKKFKTRETFDMFLMKLLKEGKKETFILNSNQFFSLLKQKIDQSESDTNVFDKYGISCPKVEKLHFLKDGLFDLIFQNAFFDNDQFYFFDQEWYEANIPLEFIQFRCFLYFVDINDYFTLEELFTMFNLNEFIDAFYQLESILQQEISHSLAYEMNQKANENVMDQYRNCIHKLEDLRSLSKKQEQVINELLAQKEAFENKGLLKKLWLILKGVE